MKQIYIIGAGMSGLLAANMLRSHTVQVYEAQPSLPNNHHALLRFRTDAVANALGIPFKKVRVMKDVHMEGYSSKLSPALAYGLKVASSSGLRSIVSAMEGEICERFIAPTNLIELIAKDIDIWYNVKFDRELDAEINREEAIVISTLPMNILAEVLGYTGFKNSKFKSVPGVVVSADLDTDIYASLYIPQPELAPYRISVTGNRLLIEYLPGARPEPMQEHLDQAVERALVLLGLGDIGFSNAEMKYQRYAKILPIPEDERKRFIMWATEEMGIFSLGRFATWKPGLLMDDVVNDVRVIQNMINYGPAGKFYEMRKS